MRTPERESLMQKYFTVYGAEYPSFSNIIRISLGMVLFGTFIMYYFQNTMLAGIVIVLVGLSLFTIWLRPYYRDVRLYQERPTDEQMYKWLITDLNSTIKERAIDTLRLNMSELKPENFLLVPYPLYWAEPGVNPASIYVRDTDSGHDLYSVWKVQVIALTKNYISFYNCTYDWMNNLIVNERTNEFFYDDISSVKNDVQQIKRRLLSQADGDAEDAKLTTYVFEVTNMSSDSHSVITKIPELKYSPALEVSLEKAVQALRITIRNRRYAEEQDSIIFEVENKKDQDEDHPKE